MNRSEGYIRCFCLGTLRYSPTQHAALFLLSEAFFLVIRNELVSVVCGVVISSEIALDDVA